MRRIMFVFLMTIIIFSCNVQNSVTSNKIITTKSNKFGVQSKTGEILIDTIFTKISRFYNLGRKTLPPSKKIHNDPVEFYLVSNETRQLALFDKDGLNIFGFTDCFQIEVDKHTQTIVKTVRQDDNKLRSYLYGFDSRLIFDTSFENIGYINNSDLIALIAEDSPNEEYYIYNPFTKIKLGPYSHFNVFSKDSSPLLGMSKDDFEKYRILEFITVQQNLEGKYIWAIINMKGIELLPMEYEFFKVIDNNMKERFIQIVSKPEGIVFLFYSKLISDKSKMVLFDEKMEMYIFDNDSKKILKYE